jgi:hypothetical protein
MGSGGRSGKKGAPDLRSSSFREASAFRVMVAAAVPTCFRRMIVCQRRERSDPLDVRMQRTPSRPAVD